MRGQIREEAHLGALVEGDFGEFSARKQGELGRSMASWWIVFSIQCTKVLQKRLL